MQLQFTEEKLVSTAKAMSEVAGGRQVVDAVVVSGENEEDEQKQVAERYNLTSATKESDGDGESQPSVCLSMIC